MKLIMRNMVEVEVRKIPTSIAADKKIKTPQKKTIVKELTMMIKT